MEQEQNRSLLIIKGNPQSILAAEGFLRNRDWKVKSTSNLKEALVYLVQEQPAFVMISIDHPNKKVRNLPKVLAQAFPVCVIAFAEESSAAAYKQLSMVGSEYLIYPPITGPAIERTVNKYYKDQVARAALGDYQQKNGLEDEKGSAISIKGKGFSNENAQNLLAQMLSGEPTDANPDYGHLGDGSSNSYMASGGSQQERSNSNSGPAYIPPGSDTNGVSGAGGSSPAGMIPPSSAQNPHSPGYMPSGEPGSGSSQNGAAYMGGSMDSGPYGSGPSAAPFGHDQASSQSGNNPPKNGYSSSRPGENPYNEFDPSQNGSPRGANGLDPSRNGSSAQGTNGAFSAGETPASGSQPDTRQNKNGHANGYRPEEDDDSLSPHFSRSQKNNGPTWAPVPEKPKVKERPGPETDDDSLRGSGDGESLILKGTRDALEKSCIQLSIPKTEAIDQSTNMACISVESTRFSGYLVTAMGKDKVIDQSFIDKIQKRLFRFLKENGESITEKDSMDLKLRPVPFEDWALDYADFMRKSQHLGSEVAMAFFPRTEVNIRFDDSIDPEMAAVNIEEFQGDTPVNFNLYVHLPKNNRYVLYTPRGGTFYSTQKDRLSNNGISRLHVLKAEMKDLDRYRAENYLNEKIEHYEARAKLKKAAA